MSQMIPLPAIVEKLDRAIEFLDPVAGFSTLRAFENLLNSNQTDSLYDNYRKHVTHAIESVLGKTNI